MINIALCDDDIELASSIAKLMESALMTIDFDAEISLITNKQNIIFEKIKNKEIDILFLDVDFNNKGKNGIVFAKELREINKDFKLIFITGYFEYSMLAFKCKTFDYLLKPATINNITDVLNRLKSDFMESNFGLLKVNRDFIVKTQNILFIERNKSKTTIYTKDSAYQTNLSLNSIKDDLPNSFVRNHRSYIVNCEQIQKIDKEQKMIIFNNNYSCPLGQFDYKM